MGSGKRAQPRRSTPGVEALYERCDEPVVEMTLALRSFMHVTVPDADERFFDASYALSIQYGTTSAWRDAFCFIAAYPHCVNLGFHRGAEIPDPHHLLAGDGKIIRHVRIASEAQLADLNLRALVVAAESLSAARAKDGR